ncbi:MAG: hypothetical protein WCX90_07585 [Thiohalomonadaceae bacterium]|jgi:hypothetical protein
MLNIQDYKLGENTKLLTLATVDDFRVTSLALAQQARRTLHIFTQDLDHALFDIAEFEEATSQLARHSQYSHVRILLQDSSAAVRRGHRLVDLAHRLSSHIAIRKPIAEYADLRQSFLLADETGYVSRQMADRYSGVADFNDRSTARNLVNLFNEVWERSQSDPQLRRLYL